MDIIAHVIAVIQPVIVKSITVAVTSAVETATLHIMANVTREMEWSRTLKRNCAQPRWKTRI